MPFGIAGVSDQCFSVLSVFFVFAGVFAMSDGSNLVPFFDELLNVRDIVPRIRSELETVLSRMNPENPEHAKLQSLQCVLSGNFRIRLSASVFQALEHGMDYSDNFPDSVNTVHKLIKKLEF